MLPLRSLAKTIDDCIAASSNTRFPSVTLGSEGLMVPLLIAPNQRVSFSSQFCRTLLDLCCAPRYYRRMFTGCRNLKELASPLRRCPSLLRVRPLPGRSEFRGVLGGICAKAESPSSTCCLHGGAIVTLPPTTFSFLASFTYGWSRTAPLTPLAPENTAELSFGHAFMQPIAPNVCTVRLAATLQARMPRLAQIRGIPPSQFCFCCAFPLSHLDPAPRSLKRTTYEY